MTTIDDWADYLQATGASPSTIKIRTATIKALTNHAEVADPLDITRRHALSFLARPRAQWTRVTYWRSINAWCKWLTEFEIEHHDLLKGVPKPRVPESVARPIDDTDVQTLLSARLPRRTRAYVLLALYCGLRVHEIAKLRGEDFDLDSRWLMVKGKGGITKPIPVHPEIVELAARMPEFGHWFPSSSITRGHVSAEAVSQTITAALRSVGIDATAHQLRDTAATRFQRQVKDIRLTQALLRHRNIASTMKYTAVSNDALQSAVDLMTWGDAA